MTTSIFQKKHRLYSITLVSASEKTTKQLGEILGKELKKRMPETGTAFMISLRGELGSGKTTLIQGIARGLGIRQNIISPTFLLMRVYPWGKKKKLLHIDAYRIAHKKEAAILEGKGLFSNPNHVIVVEWPERIPHLVKRPLIAITLAHGAHERERIMKIRAGS